MVLQEYEAHTGHRAV